MKFTFEEAELINQILEDNDELREYDALIRALKEAKENTEAQELVSIAESVILKLSSLRNEKFDTIVLPIDIYSEY